jgi:UDPglucose--hexose-1-phosphate uridylyltransferase
MSELRRDPIFRRWSVIAEERIERPTKLAPLMEAGPCPFCPGQEHLQPHELLRHVDPRGRAPYLVRVFPNQIPALRVEGELKRVGHGPYDRVSAIGAHEVIVETADHDRQLADLDEDELLSVFLAIRERISDLRRDKRFRQFVVHKSHGALAGAKWRHGHIQLMALPVVPLLQERQVESVHAHFVAKERCLLCDLVAFERGDKQRIVFDNGGAIAFTAYAPQAPFETWVMPSYHIAGFEREGAQGYRAIAEALSTTLRKLRATLDDPAYHLTLHTAPVDHVDAPFFHFFIRIVPVLFAPSSFDRATSMAIVDTYPEDAARWLNESKGR